MQLRDAAEALGVHYQTVYGWVRQGTLPARKTPRGYEVSEGDVGDLLARRAAGAEPPAEIQVRDWAAQASRLHAALVAGDEAKARHDFGRLAAGVPLTELCDLVIAPALRRVGAEWAADELSIATEHRATAICERLIAARVHQPRGRPRGVAVTATPPGERHALPAMMAAACLREDHWQVHHLAADLPVDEVVSLAADTGASLVVLSTATPGAARLAAGEARGIRARLPAARVLTGRPGDTLSRLRELARAAEPAGSLPAGRRRRAGLDADRVHRGRRRHRVTDPAGGDDCRGEGGRRRDPAADEHPEVGARRNGGRLRGPEPGARRHAAERVPDPAALLGEARPPLVKLVRVPHAGSSLASRSSHNVTN
jgi:excisionase family DNA binding protein